MLYFLARGGLISHREHVPRNVSMKNGLRVLRAQHDLTQAQLAEILGVSRQTINAVETGKYDPCLLLAFKIANVFGLTIEELFDPKP
jgi:putative transcriptional regulator